MTQKIIEYAILSSNQTGVGPAKDLQGQVQDVIADGWQPYGNPYAAGTGVIVMFQAIVKYETPHPLTAG